MNRAHRAWGELPAEAAAETEPIEAANREAEAKLERDATAERIWHEELRLLGVHP